MNVQERYRGFTLTWKNPPPVGEGYQINISSEDLDLNGLVPGGMQVRPRQSILNDAQREAQQFIDSLLSASGRGVL